MKSLLRIVLLFCGVVSIATFGAAQQPQNMKVKTELGKRRFDTEAIPLKGRSTVTDPIGRTVYLQLPLSPKPVHWMFASKDDLLAGKLTLSITRGGNKQDIPIFANGQLAPEWEIIPFPPPAGVTGAYYCFRTKPEKKLATAYGDLLELEFVTTKDLEGQGPLFVGKLPAGTYRAKGAATALFDDFDPIEARDALKSDNSMNDERKGRFLQSFKKAYDYCAILDTWSTHWNLSVTNAVGWLPPEKAEELKKQVEERSKMEGRK